MLAGQRNKAMAPYESWEAEAACAGLDSAFFFAETRGQNPAGRKVCTRCPVRQQCQDFAVRTEQPFGMWGGLSENQIQNLISAKRREPAA